MHIFIILFSIAFFLITYRRFENGIFLLFLLLPTYLIRFHIGPLPSTLLEVMALSLTGITIINILQSEYKKQTKKFLQNTFLFLWSNSISFYKKNKLLACGILIFLLGATISIFTSVDIRAALGEWRAFYFEPIILFFILNAVLNEKFGEHKKKAIQQYILFPLILCGLATSILAIYQHFTGWLVPYSFWQNRATYRVTGWYGFPNAVGLFLAPLIPLAILILVKLKDTYQNTKKFQKLNFKMLIKNSNLNIENYLFVSVCFLFLLTAPLALLFAKGSGSILGAIAGIGILLLYKKKFRWPAIVLGVLGLITLLTASPLHTLKQELLAEDYSGSLRRDIWRETISLLKDHPLVGTGIASYDERIIPYRHNHWIEVFHHPHNIFLTIWVNTGIVGLIGFVLILIATFQTACKTKTQETKYFLSTLIIILVMGLVDSPYIKNDLAILFWTVIFILTIQSDSKN